METNFLIKPELLKLTKLLKTATSLPSTIKLCELLETTENKVRTMQKELLYFKFIYSQSSSGYSVNTWTNTVLNRDFKLRLENGSYIFETINKTFIKFKIDLFENIFKTSLDPQTDYDASVLLYFFIIMSKSYKCIHENKIFIDNNKLVLNIDVLKYKTQSNICTLQMRFSDTMQWKS